VPSTAGSFPARDALVDKGGRATLVLINWANSVNSVVEQSAQRLAVVAPTLDQNAAIGTTPIPLGALAQGVYRVSVFMRVTVAAVTSSSLTLTVGFTHGGVSCTFSGAALTGNTTATVQSNQFVIAIDASTPVTYAFAYASNGAGEMKYTYRVVLERIQ